MDALSTQIRRYPDFDLHAFNTDGLSPLDAAFAHALYDAVVRRWITLWHVIEWRLERPGQLVEPRAGAALLAGAAQILFLDKVPVHAAVDTSVEWAKTKAGAGAGRLVNAILRGIAGLIPETGKEKRETYEDRRDELPLADGTALALGMPILPSDPLHRLSVATSAPMDLLRTWSKHKGLREARRLGLHGLCTPPIILNTAYASAPLPPECAPHSAPGHHVYSGPHDMLTELLRARRDIWAQDPASSLAVGSITDLRPSLVVDACAGMGTKTRQLSAAFPNATIIASDVDQIRVEALRRATEGTNVTVAPYNKLIDWAEKADLVLLDVPCSNTGVLARRVEARYRFDREHLDKLTAAQRQIIADSLRLLRRSSGGRIMYSTCSLDPGENQEQAAWASRWHGFRIGREHERAPQGLPGGTPDQYTDGSYAVLLE